MRQSVTGERGSKSVKNRVTYFMDGPLQRLHEWILSLVSACIAPMRSKIKSTAEPGREMSDKGEVLASAIERWSSDKVDERPDSGSIRPLLSFITRT